MEQKNNTFTAKEEKFSYEYCIDLNATKAAIRAGYSSKTARAISSRLLTKANIQMLIKEKQNDLAKTAGISALKIINELAKIAFTNATRLRNGWMELKDFEKLTENEKACIQSVETKETTKTFDGVSTIETWVKVKLYDKQKALDSLNSMFGFNAPVKQDVNIKGSTTILLPGAEPINFDNLPNSKIVENED